MRNPASRSRGSSVPRISYATCWHTKSFGIEPRVYHGARCAAERAPCRARLIPQLRVPEMPFRRRLVCGGGADDRRLLEVPADELKTDRHTVAHKAARNRDGRATGEIERRGEALPRHDELDLLRIGHAHVARYACAQ